LPKRASQGYIPQNTNLKGVTHGSIRKEKAQVQRPLGCDQFIFE
jgi:hypothetical protein